MSDTYVAFDETWERVRQAAERLAPSLSAAGVRELSVIRDLTGRVRLLAPDTIASEPAVELSLRTLAEELHLLLGAHAYEPSRAILSVDVAQLRDLASGLRVEITPELAMDLIDRTVTGAEWSTSPIPRSPSLCGSMPHRFTLYSVKGGMGRSTTTAVLATHLAQQGRKVLTIDLDLESPGVSGLLLAPNEFPECGVVDWFVEDMVGQSEYLMRDLVGRPRWEQDFRGELMVVPAHGRSPGDYLAKLGRVYLDRPDDTLSPPIEHWTKRLSRLLESLESSERPDVVLLDARNGLHDLAAAAVAGLEAHVVIFAMNSQPAWTGYEILFRHWRTHQLAASIRERLILAAALVPENSNEYLTRFRERSWDLFREYLYDEVPPGVDASELFSFDLGDDSAPHTPLPIYWNQGLAAISSLRTLESSHLALAYRHFLEGFDATLDALQGDSQ